MQTNIFSMYEPDTGLNTVLYSGFVAGVLDAIAGVIVYFIYFDLNPIQVLQFIASGVYGPTAIGGGALMVVMGTFFHFLIAYVCAALFFLSYKKIKFIENNIHIVGLAFGLGIWLVMNILVLPNSNIPKSPFDGGLAAVGIIWHMVLVGWPIAIITKSYYLKKG